MSAESTTSGAVDKFDDAKGRLRAGAEEPATSKRAARTPASYHVFRLAETGAWTHLTVSGAIPALTAGKEETKKQEAIKAASDSLTPDELTGTFVAVRESEWVPVKRKVQEVLTEVFE